MGNWLCYFNFFFKFVFLSTLFVFIVGISYNFCYFVGTTNFRVWFARELCLWFARRICTLICRKRNKAEAVIKEYIPYHEESINGLHKGQLMHCMCSWCIEFHQIGTIYSCYGYLTVFSTYYWKSSSGLKCKFSLHGLE